jgi:hypothetical protein
MPGAYHLAKRAEPGKDPIGGHVQPLLPDKCGYT